MQTAAFDRREALRAIDDVAQRLTAMVTTTEDPRRPVPATPDWTVSEAFAHVVTEPDRYAQGVLGEGEWAGNLDAITELNARSIASLPSLEIGWLAAELRTRLAALGELIDGFGDDQPVIEYNAGQKTRADRLLGLLLGELVIHGHDVAQALGRPWPIDPRHVELIYQGVTPLLPGCLDPRRVRGHTGRYEVRLRDQGVHRMTFEDGALTMDPPDPFRPDVVLSADPATWLLVFYRRRRQGPAFLTGKLTAWGRKPWLALFLINRFHQP